MNKSKITEYDYIDFLIGTQRVYSNTEVERVCPQEDGAAHDAYTRQLHRLVPTTERLWSEAREHIDLKKCVLIINDSTLDKFYSKKIELVTRYWSGKHKRVVSEINLVTMLWTDGERHIFADSRIFSESSTGFKPVEDSLWICSSCYVNCFFYQLRNSTCSNSLRST